MFVVVFYLVGGGFFLLHLLSFFVFFVLSDGLVYVFYFGGLDLFYYVFNFVFYFDLISVVFFSVIMLISFVVFFYINFYMGGMLKFWRFYWMVFFFVVSMVLLVFSPNLFSVIVGWDGLGITSFLLVCFYDDLVSFFSSLVVFFSNRLGDGLLLISFSVFMAVGDVDYYYFGSELGFLFAFFLFLVFFTSSAQYPFMVWLPLAMAAPTPVSSLVHSSTLVTAGVYLVIRFYVFLVDFFGFAFVRWFSLVTFFFAGLLGVSEMDLSSVIAFSTLSQLGMMFYICSLGLYFYSYMLLLYHALYKSLLFLVFGYLMKVCFGSQDGRFLGVSFLDYPFLLVILFLSGGSLFGMPFLAGFYVSDLVFSFLVFFDVAFLEILIFFFGCVFTFVYSLSIFKFVYFMWFSGGVYFFVSVDWWVFFVLFYLSLYSVFFGGYFSDYVCSDLFVMLYGFESVLPVVVLFFAVFFFVFCFYFVYWGGVFWGSFFYLYYFVYEFWAYVFDRLFYFVVSDMTWVEFFVWSGFVSLKSFMLVDLMVFINYYVGVSLMFMFMLVFGFLVM